MDSLFCRDVVVRDAKAIFQEGEACNVEILCRGDDLKLSKTQINSENFSFSDSDLRNQRGDVFCVLRQRNSWSQIQISLSCFHSLIDAFNPFPYYLDIIRAFRIRQDDDEKVRRGYRWKIADMDKHDEFCYNIRYIARNGRTGIQDPWSLRQVGVYEQYDTKLRTSLWIIIQPSEHIFQYLEGVFQPGLDGGGTSFRTHAALLFTTMREWSDYIDDLRRDMEKLENRALYSKVGKVVSLDYIVEFSDGQALQRIRKKLFRAVDDISSNIDIVRGCKTRCRQFVQLYQLPLQKKAMMDLRVQAHELENLRSVIKGMIEYSSGIANLLGRILEFRHDESMRVQTQMLNELTRDRKRSGENMERLQVQTASDSKLLKALTGLATLYLPANFVATFLGSNLVQLEKLDQAVQKYRIVLVKGWVYVATAGPLTFFTLLYILWIARRSSRLNPVF